MSLFKDILGDITKRLYGQEIVKEEITKEVSLIVGIPIKIDQIQIKEKTAFFSVSPTIKSKIYLKKTELLNMFKKYNIDTIV
jgi:hypothetical protein